MQKLLIPQSTIVHLDNSKIPTNTPRHNKKITLSSFVIKLLRYTICFLKTQGKLE